LETNHHHHHQSQHPSRYQHQNKTPFSSISARIIECISPTKSSYLKLLKPTRRSFLLRHLRQPNHRTQQKNGIKMDGIGHTCVQSVKNGSILQEVLQFNSIPQLVVLPSTMTPDVSTAWLSMRALLPLE
jgi:hypothetical protein